VTNAPGNRSGNGLRLMHVHAHPDDESSKGAATMARYIAEGVDVHVVTCTGGERGSVLNPKLAHDDSVLANLTDVRRREMDAAREILGVRQDWLGWVDSGLPEGDPLPPLPEGCFALMDVEVAAEPLVRLVRSFRPHVMTTYDENGGYPHPDHIMCHRISVHAFEAAGDPDRYPGAGEPWQPLKLYYSVWARKRMEAMHRRFGELGLESPFQDAWFETEWGDSGITTEVDVAGFSEVRSEALLAHETQIDPKSPFWFGLPPEELAKLNTTEEYVRARSLVEAPLPEDDLFAGVRETAQWSAS
jgi:mycothiol S-conjugate amidase